VFELWDMRDGGLDNVTIINASLEDFSVLDGVVIYGYETSGGFVLQRILKVLPEEQGQNGS